MNLENTAPRVKDVVYWHDGPVAEPSRGVCKVTVSGVCGSGSLVGKRNGRSLVMTNAHVAGTRIGRQVNCQFPFLNNRNVPARIIMAGYSDRVLMDWAVLELDQEITELPHTPMRSNQLPGQEAYTAGYPRCRGPYFSRLRTQSITHNGTLWRWHPNAIGGQSGSAVHVGNLQFGVLTWSWGGDGAGQTTRGIYQQYARRSVFGLPRPEGLVELGDTQPPEELEEGFFSQTNVTTLPIWSDGSDPGERPQPDPDAEPCPELAKKVLKFVDEWDAELDKLREVANSYMPPPPEEDDDDGGCNDGGGSGGGTFGL